jgi:hypothetical protein
LWHHARVKKGAAPKKTTKPTTKKPATKKPAAKAAAPAMKYGPRKDLGAPIDAFFTKQPPHIRPIVEELRKMVEDTAPDAASAIKWGMPFFSVGDTMMCAIAAHKSHVNLILSGPPGTYADPKGLLEGDGKTGRHLKLRALDDLPRAEVRAWLRAAVAHARK